MDAGGAVGGRLQVGQLIRDRRLELGLDLEQVAADTHISVAYLTGLESGRYDDMPSVFWAEQFMRSYAKALDLPWDELRAVAFADPSSMETRSPSRAVGESGPQAMPDAAALPPRARSRARSGQQRPQAPGPGGRPLMRRERAGFWGPYVITPLTTLVALAAIVIVVLHLIGGPSTPRHPVPPASGHTNGGGTTGGTGHGNGAKNAGGDKGGTSTGGKNPKSGGGQSGGKKSGNGGAKPPKGGSVTLARTGGGVSAYTAASGPLTATVKIAWPTWVRVVADGKPVLVKLEPTGFTGTYTATRSLNVYLGYPRDSAVTINGTQIGPLTGTDTQWLDFTAP